MEFGIVGEIVPDAVKFREAGNILLLVQPNEMGSVSGKYDTKPNSASRGAVRVYRKLALQFQFVGFVCLAYFSHVLREVFVERGIPSFFPWDIAYCHVNELVLLLLLSGET